MPDAVLMAERSFIFPFPDQAVAGYWQLAAG